MQFCSVCESVSKSDLLLIYLFIYLFIYLLFYFIYFSLPFPREEGGQCKCNFDRLKNRKNLLQKYIDENADLELQALYAVQALFVELDYPPGTSVRSCCPCHVKQFNFIYWM